MLELQWNKHSNLDTKIVLENANPRTNESEKAGHERSKLTK